MESLRKDCMIKINLNSDTKKEIEKLYLEDARKMPTGLFRVLSDPNIEKSLRQWPYRKLHDALYDPGTGRPRENEIKKLLLADRKALEDYIDRFEGFAGAASDFLLEYVFRYDRYAKRACVHKILRKMDVAVCPYCNRQFTSTIVSGKVRPQLDHFFPEGKYPYLALSLYNMIPSCGTCNLSKLSLDTHDTPIVYPFDEEFGYGAKFEIRMKGKQNFVRVMQGASDEFLIALDTAKAQNAAAIETQMEQLHLDELYREHTEYVMDIIRSKYVNTPARIGEIRRMFPKLFRSDDEVKNMLYMTDLRKESWGRRPLSKLTHDIDRQLEGGLVRYGE